MHIFFLSCLEIKFSLIVISSCGMDRWMLRPMILFIGNHSVSFM